MLIEFAVEIPTLRVDQCHSHLIQFLKECQAVLLECRAAEKGRQAYGTHMVYRKRFFVNPDAFIISTISSRIESMEFIDRGPLHSSTVEKSERRTQNQDQRCQSGPSAKNSVIFSGGDSPKNYGADQQRLQISDLHFDKFPTPATFVCWKKRFKAEVCTCSQFLMEAMQWIKEVEMVDSVDDLKSSSSTRSISMPKFEVLDARIASALNKIIHNSHFKRRIGLEEQKAQKQDRGLRNDDIQESDSKWDGILLSLTKIPPDDILEGLYKLRTRASEKLKTVLELYDLEIHQKKLGPDYHRLKTMVKRSIEQDKRKNNIGARNGNYEKKRRGQESGNKTACIKNSWRLLAMGGVQRAVF